MKTMSILLLAALMCVALGASAFPAEKQFTVLSQDSIPLSYTVQGSGEPALVFVHCWCCDKTYWKNQVPYFEKKYTVVTLDLAGHGASGLGRKDYTIESFGADVASVVNALGLTKVILIGHSMGGDVNLEAARRLSGKVIALVGVDTYQDFADRIPPEQRAKYIDAFTANFEGVTEKFVRSMFPAKADTALETSIASDMASESPRVGISAFKNMMDYDPLPAVKELRIPIKCVNADLWVTNVEGNKKLAYSFDVKYMTGHGHFLLLEDPATFNKLLDETIAEIVKGK
ncbi:MAG TPA: alpha/beta hydrolase [Candidatus Krumholzibacteriaceae bacterium]